MNLMYHKFINMLKLISVLSNYQILWKLLVN